MINVTSRDKYLIDRVLWWLCVFLFVVNNAQSQNVAEGGIVKPDSAGKIADNLEHQIVITPAAADDSKNQAVPQVNQLPPVQVTHGARSNLDSNDAVKPLKSVKIRRPSINRVVPEELKKEPTYKLEENKLLAEYVECQNDIERFCPKVAKKSDIAVAQCLEERKEEVPLETKCQSVLWSFKKWFTEDKRLHKAALEYCGEELDGQKLCKDETANKEGHYLSCLLEVKEKLTNRKCLQFLDRIESIVFADYRLIGPFINHCHEDIKTHDCGRTDYYEDSPHSQGETIECLMKILVKELPESVRNKTMISPPSPGQFAPVLAPQCRKQLFRLAELQADDFHLDRNLYFACREDREHFCGNVQAGEGRVMDCLIKFSNHRQMSQPCREKVYLRQEIAAQDAKVAHALIKSCQQAIDENKCLPPNPEQGGQPSDAWQLSHVLLCLENAAHLNKRIEGACQQEMFQHRKSLMTDYHLSPEVVYTCSREIDEHCKDAVHAQKQREGQVVQCLISIVNPRSKYFTSVNQQCKRAVGELVKIADPASDYRVDPVLELSCGTAIDQHCHDQKKDEGSILACLMDNVESNVVDGECENRLLEVQYFMSRDYAMDPGLFRACHVEASTYCHAGPQWTKDLAPQNNQPDGRPLVLPCLYRLVYHLDRFQPEHDGESSRHEVSKACAVEVTRVVHSNAASVNLIPEIIDNCLPDLAQLCSDKTGPGEELMCLQEHYSSLTKDGPCQKAVGSVMEMESKDVRVNKILDRACRPLIEKHCNQGDMSLNSLETMECLRRKIEFAEEDSKCRVFIEHFELATLQNYHFSPKFREACDGDIQAHCTDIKNKQNKQEIVVCLSTVVFESQVLGEGDELKPKCKDQLRKEYLMEQPILSKIDPDLTNLCGSEIERLCKKHVDRPMKCLRKHKDQIKDTKCRRYLFKHERIQAADNTFDRELISGCEVDIKKYCSQVPKSKVLHCLREAIVKDPSSLTRSCNDIVVIRKRENAGNINLQPVLKEACLADVKKWCGKEMEQIKANQRQKDGPFVQNTVVGCLRQKFISNKEHHLQPGCRVELRRIILESEMDPKLDPPFYEKCKGEIERMCSESILEKGHEHATVVECMKNKLYQNLISDQTCVHEMERRTNEELVDIHLDPALLEACGTEIRRYCKEMRSGQGRVISCLIDATSSSNTLISDTCRGKLHERQQLWKQVFKDKVPENFQHLAQQLQQSPIYYTILTWLAVIVAVIFVIGLCCGRATKRIRQELKSR